ncbi:MAG: DNA polymerase IV [Zetaproteobacteria bacterium CG_4_9_14_3_um_filter_49_83]|nr:MAG: DNA polymerase IV [Zetaproteobacteria bacterium CG1_02_49_23]PIQ34684.1 MAG: DNA polymerase IV [Zetaproteobacteria bacterium CG17_big_fil_post_rev_8_21_14_2_50_50_13]PIY54979.1 MAG: DNA polymerase IV [Zetaproteobacteria bacterium CG_4_10_14_0_8_um_filter_49_80]PJA34267.1 MAG: DNA polymerase IV [Zetaproteobacteria bacterium CG_4_9_14_3_um_filter_49_83]
MTDWRNAIAHIDADCFYVSCEMTRHPELQGQPVCVLFNQGAFVIAKSYDAKARGISTGMSVWDARKRMPDAVFLMPDFHYYGLLSEKMFAVFRRFSPDVEVYSIDEAFVDMNGIRSLWHKSFRQLGDAIRHAVAAEVGITVSVGISTSKTLAKIASECNKPDGTTVIPGKRIGRFLADIAVQDIPGIGRNRACLLHKFNIRTAAQFAMAEESQIGRVLGRHGLVLWHELNGESVQKLALNPPLPKSIARTASMGQVSDSRTLLAAHLSHHTHRLVSELVAKGLFTERISVFLSRQSFENTGVEMRMDCPTNSLQRISEAVRKAFMALYRNEERYRGCGVVASRISRASTATADLFGQMQADQRQTELMLTINTINDKYGRHMVTSGAASRLGKHQSNAIRFRYPLLKAG